MIFVNFIIMYLSIIKCPSICIYVFGEVYTRILQMNIFNIGFKFIRIDEMYIISNFCCAHLQHGQAIGTCLYYLKRPIIQGIIFVCIFIIEHDCVAYLLLIVYCFYILNVFIYIYLRLLSLPDKFLIKPYV